MIISVMERHDIRIEAARADDLDGVHSLLVETWHDTYDDLIGAARVAEITKAWHSLVVLQAQLDTPRASFLVAKTGHVITGHLFAAQEAFRLVVHRLYVRPACQRQGIGAKLLSEAMKRHPNARTIWLEVEANNAKGTAFYRRSGFIAADKRIEEGVILLQMERRLDPDM